MRVLKTNEFRSFEQLVSLTQKELKEAMYIFLSAKYKKVIQTDKYICAVGDIPIGLVAHLDTVFKYPAQDVYYDPKKNVLWSPDGLGADDRAGVYAIVEIVNAGLRPHIIFTTDEETGGVGATALADRRSPFKELNYLIQLDRRGSNDCVFYDCYNPSFISYVESFGFVEAWGTFSDISILCPAWKVCGVNLSVGYENEHSYIETLNFGHLCSTINKVKTMLTQANIPNFKYKRAIRPHINYFRELYPQEASYTETVRCFKCGYDVEEHESFPIKTLDGTTKHCCLDCLDDSIDWCIYCQEPFELDPKNPIYLCKDCQEKIEIGED